MITFGPGKAPEDVVAYLRNVQRQVNYASARTANNLALRVQKFTVEKLLPEKFTLRAKGAPWQRPGTKMGFNIKFATKDKPQSVIGSQADWLERQEIGGDKKGDGHRVAIPTTFWKPKADLMVRNKKPRALLELVDSAATLKADSAAAPGDRRLSSKAKRRQSKLKGFLAQFGLFGIFKAKMHNGVEGIFARTGTGHGPIKALFLFEEDVHIKPILEFEKKGREIINQNLDADFAIEFAKAMSDSK
jgi:hypothetical protein